MVQAISPTWNTKRICHWYKQHRRQRLISGHEVRTSDMADKEFKVDMPLVQATTPTMISKRICQCYKRHRRQRIQSRYTICTSNITDKKNKADMTLVQATSPTKSTKRIWLWFKRHRQRTQTNLFGGPGKDYFIFALVIKKLINLKPELDEKAWQE